MKNLVFILLASLCAAQKSDQYTQILLSKKLGEEVISYTQGYGFLQKSPSGGAAIVDSTGQIAFDLPVKGHFQRLAKDRFIFKATEGENSGNYALLDNQGNYLLPFSKFTYRTWQNKERLIISSEGKDRVVDYNGKEIIGSQNNIEFASDSRFCVQKNKIWLLYDFDGKLISEREFDKNLNFYKDKVYLNTGPKTGEVIDINGKTIGVFSQHYIEDINGFPYLITKNLAKKKFGLVDENEQVIADNVYDQAYVGRNYIYLIKDNKASVFSKAEKKLFATDFHYITHLFNGVFKTLKDSKNPKIAVIKANGEVILPKEYDVVEAFKINEENYIYTSKNGEETLLDQNFVNVLEDGYSIEKVFYNNIIVQKNGNFFRFSPHNKKYYLLNNIASIKPFQFYPAIICKNDNDLYGIINEDGKEVVPFIYDDIVSFLSGSEVVVEKDGKFGVTNLKNEPLKEIIYDKYSADRKKITLTKDKDSEVIMFSSDEES